MLNVTLDNNCVIDSKCVIDVIDRGPTRRYVAETDELIALAMAGCSTWRRRDSAAA